MRVTDEIVLEAYLAVSPRSPRWSRVSFTAVEGHDNYYDDPRVVSGGGWTFHTIDGAITVLRELQKLPQNYYLRVSRRTVIEEITPLAGADITNGAIVDGPGEKMATARNPFWEIPKKVINSIISADDVGELWGGKHGE